MDAHDRVVQQRLGLVSRFFPLRLERFTKITPFAQKRIQLRVFSWIVLLGVRVTHSLPILTAQTSPLSAKCEEVKDAKAPFEVSTRL